ncbi:hypothetical protein JAAARDRAFT_101085, partial [Jaapia argillacea MUCL 33604]
AYTQTLQFITSIKVQEIEKQCLVYEEHAKVLDIVHAMDEDDLVGKIETLLQAVRSWSGSGTFPSSSSLSGGTQIDGKLDLANMDVWLMQAKMDPSFSKDILRGWIQTLEAQVRHLQTRFEFTKLFGNLLKEWAESGDALTAFPSVNTPREREADVEFVKLERKESYEQKEKLESIIFDDKPIDTSALIAYLEELFASEEGQSAISVARLKIRGHAEQLLAGRVTVYDVRWTIQSLLASDLMDESKRSTLRELYSNPTSVEDLASVLTLRLANIASWSWPPEGITVDMRRHLSGKYRAYMDPSLLDGLFLQYIGVKWQVQFKRTFQMLFKSPLWKSPFSPLTKAETERRRTYFCEEDVGVYGLESLKTSIRVDNFLASQLPSRVEQVVRYHGADEGMFDQEMMEIDNDTSNTSHFSVTAVKQKLLHLMMTDTYLDKTLHGQHTIVCTDFEWFGPSLPHSSILILLAFFGVPQQWLDFFQAFLSAPLRFAGESGTRIRRRGVPISYALSALCGEVILFAMDFAVNQKASGLFLYRMHDDVWFWDHDLSKCEDGWKEILRYAELVGIHINFSKTGSAFVKWNTGEHSEEAPTTQSDVLPVGPVRWGFLKFDTASGGHFILDQGIVNPHIVEFHRQLSNMKSLLGWQGVWNRYMGFFERNFGGGLGLVGECVGRNLVGEIVETLGRVERETVGLFYPAGAQDAGSVVGLLKKMIRDRPFAAKVNTFPQGWFYLPLEKGGLGLSNPIAHLVGVMNSIPIDPEERFRKQLTQGDVETYRDLRDRMD